MTTAVIYLGGQGPSLAPQLDDVQAVIAADSGLDLALSHDMNVDVVVGDLDSVKPDSLERARSQGSDVRAFPYEKNETDFELAILAANEFDCDHLVIIGGGGERTDHLFGNISVMSGMQTKQWIVDAYFHDCRIHVCRSYQSREFRVREGTSISLLPIGDVIHGVTTSGLKWELSNATLSPQRALGLSNVCLDEEISISIGSGNLAVIFPS